MKHIAYDNIRVEAFNEGMAAIMNSDGVGFINTDGELVIPPIFEHAGHPKAMINTNYIFKDGLSACAKEGKWGYIDKKGNIVISPEYDSASPFNDGIAVVSKDGKWGAIDKSGKTVIAIEYDFVQPSSEGVCGAFKDNRRGYIDCSGNEVISLTAKYDIIQPFTCGVAVVMVGKWKLPALKPRVNESYNDYSVRYKKAVEKFTQNNFYGAINKKGELTIELKYKFLSFFRDSLAAALIDGKQMYINTAGETVLEVPQYESISTFYEGLAGVRADKKWGCIDKSGRPVIPTVYDSTPIFRNQYAHVSKSSKWGLIDKSGAVRLPIEYDSVSSMENGYAVVRKGSSWWIFNVNDR